VQKSDPPRKSEWEAVDENEHGVSKLREGGNSHRRYETLTARECDLLFLPRAAGGKLRLGFNNAIRRPVTDSSPKTTIT